jgi:hypothetical protein
VAREQEVSLASAGLAVVVAAAVEVAAVVVVVVVAAVAVAAAVAAVDDWDVAIASIDLAGTFAACEDVVEDAEEVVGYEEHDCTGIEAAVAAPAGIALACQQLLEGCRLGGLAYKHSSVVAAIEIPVAYAVEEEGPGHLH